MRDPAIRNVMRSGSVCVIESDVFDFWELYRLVQNRAGGLISVLDERGVLVGTITSFSLEGEFDKALRALASGQGCCFRAGSLADFGVRPLTPDTPRSLALKALYQVADNHLPVVEDDVVVGTLTVGDVAASLAEEQALMAEMAS